MTAELKIAPLADSELDFIRKAASQPRTRRFALEAVESQRRTRSLIQSSVENRRAELAKWEGWLSIADDNVRLAEAQLGGIAA